MLFLHLVPDGIDGFCPPFYFKFQTLGFEFSAYRLDECIYVCVTTSFCFVQFSGYAGICFAVCVLQRHILKFRFDGIQSEPVRQRGIKIIGLVGDIAHQPLRRMVVYRSHKRQTVDNHYDYHAYVLGECQQKLTEVITLDRRAATIQRSHLAYARNKPFHICAPTAGVHVTCIGQHYSQNHIAVGA